MRTLIQYSALLLGLILAMLPMQTAIAGNLYKVEIIVFKHNNKQTLPSEDWQQQKKNTSGKVKQLLPKPQDLDYAFNTYQVLPKSELTLTSEQRALTRKKNFNVLLHVAWLQELPEKSYAKPVHIFGGKALSPEGEAIDEEINIYAPSQIDAQSGLQWEIDGTLRASRVHQFNLKTNLVLTTPSQSPQNSQSSETSATSHYYLTQTQSLRANELHYFDHSEFGLLAKITPYVGADSEPG